MTVDSDDTLDHATPNYNLDVWFGLYNLAQSRVY